MIRLWWHWIPASGAVRWKTARPPRRNSPLHAPVITNGSRVGPHRSAALFAPTIRTMEGTLARSIRRRLPVVPRPVTGHGLVFFGTDTTPLVYAVRPEGASGTRRTPRSPGLSTRGAPNTPSMLLVGDELYFVSDGGMASCGCPDGHRALERASGGGFSASRSCRGPDLLHQRGGHGVCRGRWVNSSGCSRRTIWATDPRQSHGHRRALFIGPTGIFTALPSPLRVANRNAAEPGSEFAGVHPLPEDVVVHDESVADVRDHRVGPLESGPCVARNARCSLWLTRSSTAVRPPVRAVWKTFQHRLAGCPGPAIVRGGRVCAGAVWTHRQGLPRQVSARARRRSRR